MLGRAARDFHCGAMSDTARTASDTNFDGRSSVNAAREKIAMINIRQTQAPSPSKLFAAGAINPGLLRYRQGEPRGGQKFANRAFLRTVDCWIREPDYCNSIFQYGLPLPMRHLIDAPMTEEVTYSDAISCLARAMGPDLRYLELGVSVGKNFSQVLRRVHGAELTGFDIEDINPVLEEMLVEESQAEWFTMSKSIREKPSRLTEYSFAPNANKVRYLAGDIFDGRSWECLAGQTFNLVFSDAFHSATALLKEWDMIKAHNLLAPDGFIMMWDDLGDRQMRTAFFQIVEEMSAEHRLDKSNAGIAFYRGWLGMHAPYHPIGFMRMTGCWR